MRSVPKSTEDKVTDMASINEDPKDAARPSHKAKKAAMERAVWRTNKRPAEALPARRTSVKRRCTPYSRKGKKKAKRSVHDESENEPVDIPIPPAPKKSRKGGKARAVYVSEQEDSDSIISVSESDSSFGLVGEDDNMDNIFDDGNATELDVPQAHGASLNLDDIAVTALAKQVLAERPQWASQTKRDRDASKNTFSVRSCGLFSDDDGSDPESPSGSLSANKENVAPPSLVPSPSPPSPPTPSPLPEVDNTGWPSYTALIYHQTNSGIDLGLSRQHYEIKMVIRRAIEIITEQVIFKDAFPSPADRVAWIRSALLTGARLAGEMSGGSSQHRYQRVRARVVEDDQYVQELSTMINPCVPLLQSQVKTLAVNNSIKSFVFQDMEVNAIVSLTNDFKYIYPVNQHGNVQGSRPYENVAIVSTIRDFLFHNSTLPTYPQRFTCGQEANHVLTPSILALVATGVAAAVDEWRTGRRIVATFTSNVYADIYRRHILLLTGIQSDNPHGYTAMLRRLYLAATSSTSGMQASSPNTSTFLDVANMAVDT